jgi:transcriptional regulator with XRE-family HTH domain
VLDAEGTTPAMRKACASRDIAAIFRFLRDGGMTQRELAVLVRMNQSEVSAILAGRQVQAYDVLVRVADGLEIPRGLIGLAYGEDAPDESAGEGDDDVERRKLLAFAGALLFGAPVFGEPEPLAPVRRVLVDPPQRVGQSDVATYETTVARLHALQRQVGGRATREPLAATASVGELLLAAEGTDDVKQPLRLLVSDAHRRAGWAAGDLRLVDDYRYHVHAALDFAAGDGDRIAQVLCMAGAMEKSFGQEDFALQVLQIGQAAAATSADPQVRAVIAGESVAGYVAVGRHDTARKELITARSLFNDADAGQSLPDFASYGNGHGVLASAELKLGNFDAARTEILTALRRRPKADICSTALDTVILAMVNIRAGEVGEAIRTTQQALVLVQQVGSYRLRDRMMPLAVELEKRNDSTCRDLARAVRAVQV